MPLLIAGEGDRVRSLPAAFYAATAALYSLTSSGSSFLSADLSRWRPPKGEGRVDGSGVVLLRLLSEFPIDFCPGGGGGVGGEGTDAPSRLSSHLSVLGFANFFASLLSLLI